MPTIEDVIELIIEQVEQDTGIEFENEFSIVKSNVALEKAFEAAQSDVNIKTLSTEVIDLSGSTWQIAISGKDKSYIALLSKRFDITLP